MINKNDRERIVTEIIDGFFNGVHSRQVESRFFEWLADDRDRDLKDRSMKRVWDRIDAGIARDGHKALARFKSLRKTESRRMWLRTAARNAAAVLIPPLAVAGAWLFAASVGGNPDAGVVEHVPMARETIIRIVSPGGGGGETVLPDNSRVTLAEGSWLQYTKETFDSERFVEMSGECGFAVAGREGRPFVVKTQNIAVTVLGTEFSVCDRPGSDVVVSLASGRVEVAFGDNERSAVLTPGETLRFDPETGASKIETTPTESPEPGPEPESEPEEAPAKGPGEFNCEEMPIAGLLAALEKHYGFRINVDPDARLRGRYSVNFSEDERLESIMNVIGIMSGLDYIVSADGREAFVTSKE